MQNEVDTTSYIVKIKRDEMIKWKSVSTIRLRSQANNPTREDNYKMEYHFEVFLSFDLISRNFLHGINVFM